MTDCFCLPKPSVGIFTVRANVYDSISLIAVSMAAVWHKQTSFYWRWQCELTICHPRRYKALKCQSSINLFAFMLLCRHFRYPPYIQFSVTQAGVTISYRMLREIWGITKVRLQIVERSFSWTFWSITWHSSLFIKDSQPLHWLRKEWGSK